MFKSVHNHKHIITKLLIVQLVSIIPFLFFIFYLFDLWYDTGRSTVLRENITEARLVSLFTNYSFNSWLRLVNNLAQNNLLQETVLKNNNKEAARTFIKNIITDSPEIISISISNKEGEIFVTSLDSVKDEEQISELVRTVAPQVLTTKTSAISNPVISTVSKKRAVVVFAVPIVINNEVTMLVSAVYDLEYLKSKIETIISEQDGLKDVVLLDKNGEIAFITNRTILMPIEVEKSLLSAPFVKEAQMGKVALVENQRIPLIDEPVMGTAVPVDEFGWVVLSVTPIKTIFAPLFKVQGMVWLIIFAMLLFSVSVISYILRKVKIVY